jgi:hypothetical protein
LFIGIARYYSQSMSLTKTEYSTRNYYSYRIGKGVDHTAQSGENDGYGKIGGQQEQPAGRVTTWRGGPVLLDLGGVLNQPIVRTLAESQC